MHEYAFGEGEDLGAECQPDLICPESAVVYTDNVMLWQRPPKNSFPLRPVIR